jgi:hypothetical protein
MTNLESLGVRTAEQARVVRHTCYRWMLHVDHMGRKWGELCRPIFEDPAAVWTNFLARWLDVLPDAIADYRLLVKLGPLPPETGGEVPLP